MRDEKRTKQQLIEELTQLRRKVAELTDGSESQYRDLVETVQDLVFRCDREGRFTYLNPAWETTVGYSLDEMLGHRFAEFKTEEQAQKDLQVFQSILAGTPTLAYETTYVAKSGELIHLVFKAVFTRDERGDIVGTHGTAVDITERIRAEEALRESEARFRSLVDSSRNALLAYDNDLICTLWNPAMEKLTGIVTQDIVGRSPIERLPLLDEVGEGDALRDTIKGIASSRSAVQITWPQTHREGWFQTSHYPVYGADGSIIGGMSVIRDVTEITQLEKEREGINHLLESMLYRTHLMFAYLDPQFNIVRVNTAFADSCRKDVSFFAGKNYFDLYPGDANRAIFQQVVASGEPASEFASPFEFPEQPDRGVAYRDWSLIPAVAEEGKVAGLVYSLVDVTDRITAEQAVKESEQRYRELVEHCQDIVWRIDTEGFFTFMSPSIKKIAGYEPEEILGSPLGTFMSAGMNEESDKTARDLLRRRLAGEFGHDAIVYELTMFRRDGSEYIGETRSGPLLGENGEIVGIQGITRDVTDRKRMEQALRDSESNWRAISENSPSHVMLLDREGDILFSNREFPGLSLEELSGRSVYEFTNAEDHAIVKDCYDRVMTSSESDSYITRYSPTAGDELIFDVRVGPVVQQGEIVGFVSCSMDITDRMHSEVELQKMEKLESIGVLAGGIAHDLNNLLTAILGNISLAKMDLKPSEKIRRLNDAERASMRVQDLAQQLLTFSKGGLPLIKTIAIGPLLRDAVSFSLSGSNVRSDLVIPDDTWAVEVDEGQINQVINNLVINAQQAMPEGGSVTVTVANEQLDAASRLPLREGPHVRITVEDQGTGIPRKHLQRIFDPFFSTKAEGSGLGLATSYSIIQKHHGHISATSEQEIGTRFTIYLPASVRGTTLENKVEEASPVTGQGRILFMDDEPSIRELATEMLTRLGYRITTSSDGTETVSIFKDALKAGDDFDAVILDLTIPGGLGGGETLQQLKQLEPTIKAIVSSGYSNDPILSSFKEYGFDGVITKPYKIHDMSVILHEVITT
jgi:PAS domain S-box-containing protein